MLAENNLRCNIARCADSEARRLLGAAKLDRAAKVSDAYPGSLRKIAHQDVLDLNVPMDNSELMQVLERLQHLSDNFLGVHLSQRLNWLFLKVVEQVASRHEFRNDVVVAGILSILIRVDHLDDVANLVLGALAQDIDFIALCLIKL